MAQDPVYHHYTTSNGLSSSEVYDIIQDDWGYIWFSTDYGLTRFDGYTFKHYSTNDGLTNNTVFKFFKDNNQRIWCTTFGPSVFLIVGEEPRFIPYDRNDVFKNLSIFHNLLLALRLLFLFSTSISTSSVRSSLSKRARIRCLQLHITVTNHVLCRRVRHNRRRSKMFRSAGGKHRLFIYISCSLTLSGPPLPKGCFKVDLIIFEILLAQ